MISIKGTFQPLLLFQIILGELDGHQVTLFNTNAMLTGQHTAHFNAAFKYIGSKILGAFQLARYVGIKQDQRMQIAVARMKHVCHPQAVLLAERSHPPHHIR